MAQQVPPVVSRKFYGINTWGNPLERTPGSASMSTDFRIMPDFYLRLRSGRRARMYNDAGTSIRKLHVYRAPENAGAETHYIQRVTASAVWWESLAVSTWSTDPFFMISINESNGGAFTRNAAAPSVNLRNRVVLYNGLGIRDGSNSRPPFCSGLSRYFGLDAYCPSGNPESSFTTGSGYNSVGSSVQIFVGLHNVGTGHFSNGVYAGTIEETGGTGTIVVASLDKLKTAYIDNAERGELQYVFYATIDGGSVPYLILNSSLNDTYKVPVTQTSAVLSLYDNESTGGNGWVLDLTSEMPTENHPPKPMRCITYVSGRMYGVLTSGGSGSAVMQQRPDGRSYRDFTYQPSDGYRAGIVYSRSAADVATHPNLIGNPEECWPLTNFSPSPNSEVPIKIAPAPTADDRPERLLVLTATKSFIVAEAADSIHEWSTISRIHGIAREECYVETAWGSIWLTQRNQIARYSEDYGQVVIISELYDSVVRGKSPVFGTYVVDPVNEIDQARFYFTDGTCLVHDFALRTPQTVHGQGYLFTGQNYTAGGTVTGTDGKVYHLLASRHIYSVEGQPEDGKVVAYDQDWGANNQSFTYANYTGQWIGQHDDYGDDSIRKTVNHVDVDGDERFTLDWYPDRCPVNASTKQQVVARQRVPDSANLDIQSFRAKPEKANARWFKWAIGLSTNYPQVTTFPSKPEEPSSNNPMFGMVTRVKASIGIGANR